MNLKNDSDFLDFRKGGELGGRVSVAAVTVSPSFSQLNTCFTLAQPHIYILKIAEFLTLARIFPYFEDCRVFIGPESDHWLCLSVTH